MDTSHTRNELYKQPPPPFGHALLKHYALDPEHINFNNGDVLTVRESDSLLINNTLGSYGTTPRPVLEAINELTAEIESNPDLFHRLAYQQRLIDVREKLSRLIGAKTDEVVLVSNASMGVNTVLRNFNWEQSDEIFACMLYFISFYFTMVYPPPQFLLPMHLYLERFRIYPISLHFLPSPPLF